MISSQILLFGFVSYWLVGQYRQERLHLHGQLKTMFFSAYDAQVDTLLMEHLIVPTLSDSMGISFDLSNIPHVDPVGDSLHATVVLKHLEADTSAQADVFAFRMSDSGSIEEERMVRSVRLFINQTEENFRNNGEAHVFSMQIDSAAVMAMLKKQFEEFEWSFSLEWAQDSLQNLRGNEKAGIVLQGLPHMELPALRVQHITPYLLGKLLPQILFVLLLLGISAAALIIAYRSLLKQITLNSLRNDFIANISHELKTPVSTVKLALEALQKFDLKQDPKVSDEYLHMASRETDRLEGLVSRVLQHQALEDAEYLLNKENCDLNLLMASAVRAMAIPIRENQASVEIIESPTPCMVQADPVYLEGVIMNLIDNSLKYAGPRPRIQLSTQCHKELKRLVVKDHGPGIPEEFKTQVFHKFFRIPSGDRHNVKGYGLGLNFAAQVMSKLGGHISFRNLGGEGCEFVIEFPNA